MHASGNFQGPIPHAVPRDLRLLPHWVVWQATHEPGRLKPRKRPFSPLTGQPTGHAPARRTEWSTFAAACRALTRGRDWGVTFSGIGFVFTAEDPFCGVDLDECLDDHGNFVPAAALLVKELDSYTELSVGGRGVHVIVRATLPGRGRHPSATSIELYDRERFFTVSGRPWPGAARAIEARDEVVGRLWREFAPMPGPEITRTDPAALPSLRDDEIMALLRRSASGPRFSALFDLGDMAHYKHNRSVADLGLANMIAFYTDDPQQIERLMRGSRLTRAKWDEARPGGTYLGNTIARARRRDAHYRGPGSNPLRPRP
jgi:putative DNA primase/helicase